MRGILSSQMTLDEKIEKLIEQESHLAFQLLFEDGGDWRKGPNEFQIVRDHFRDQFERLIKKISERYGTPSYVEREYSRKSPDWAPMGLYADWKINEQADIICLFLGGDGNPEDPLILLAGKTTQDAKLISGDPWEWNWIE